MVDTDHLAEILEIGPGVSTNFIQYRLQQSQANSLKPSPLSKGECEKALLDMAKAKHIFQSLFPLANHVDPTCIWQCAKQPPTANLQLPLSYRVMEAFGPLYRTLAPGLVSPTQEIGIMTTALTMGNDMVWKDQVYPKTGAFLVTNRPFISFVSTLLLRETTCIALKAPTPFPLQPPGYHWGDDILFNPEALDADLGFHGDSVELSVRLEVGRGALVDDGLNGERELRGIMAVGGVLPLSAIKEDGRQSGGTGVVGWGTRTRECYYRCGTMQDESEF
ncbi:hypothetical protein PAAG_04171 [Paracoccidioides lutzii Pb01]|uniref:Uncharacterized protein n=1 Tax=Paracoccidioides lutzii (strain ATCC MYA-826 / Pb01) TaxID=502779 RepID=C1H077_PARBA|nr:hypothetical protein PAAG_04171 [Paracoccidioides lutzii Pb01]EEH33118.2 hypothetical protein PAAG_04171 [Paracoccidioides lutzii Pb01]